MPASRLNLTLCSPPSSEHSKNPSRGEAKTSCIPLCGITGQVGRTVPTRVITRSRTKSPMLWDLCEFSNYPYIGGGYAGQRGVWLTTEFNFSRVCVRAMNQSGKMNYHGGSANAMVGRRVLCALGVDSDILFCSIC